MGKTTNSLNKVLLSFHKGVFIVQFRTQQSRIARFSNISIPCHYVNKTLTKTVKYDAYTATNAFQLY